MRHHGILTKTLCAALFAATAFPAAAQRDGRLSEVEKSLRKLSMAQLAISSLYVDSVDENKLTEDAINGMLSGLDPHSSYTNAEQTKKMNEPLQGNFDGIGVQFNMLEDTLVVIQPVPKGPSEKAGILAGDRIVSVNGRPHRQRERHGHCGRENEPRGNHAPPARA